MNTKQVEDLVGLSRQNIRYYEKEGLLAPNREKGNSYRDYSQEDVERLKMIKMLRMLDMPLKEIESVLKNEIPLQEAAAVRQKELLEHQKQLQAAIDICNQLKKEKSSEISVDKYLNKMEHMEKNGSVFARILDDYQQMIRKEEEKQRIFYTDSKIHTPTAFERVLKEYAKEQGLKFKMKEKGKYPKFYLGEDLYCGVYSFENPEYRVVCMKIEESQKRGGVILKLYSLAANIRRHAGKSICSFAFSLMLVLLLGIYLGNLSKIHSQIANLSESMPVYARVYNSTGNENRHLLIKQEFVDGIRASKHVREVKETAELIGKNEDEESYQILALEDEKLSGLSSGQCLVSTTFLKNNGLKAGDKISLSVYYFALDIMAGRLTEQFLTQMEFEIAGSYDMDEDIHIPLPHAKEMFGQTGTAYHASSLGFRVREPKLLNDFKKEMKELGLQTIQSGEKETWQGCALGVEDATFMEASMKLENNKTLLQSFLPVIFMVLLVAEYLVSWLLLQSRRQEFAIMRALGKSRRACSRNLLAEQMVLILGGMIAGGILCSWFAGLKFTVILSILLSFTVIAVTGVYSAVWMLGRFSVSAVLTRRD